MTKRTFMITIFTTSRKRAFSGTAWIVIPIPAATFIYVLWLLAITCAGDAW